MSETDDREAADPLARLIRSAGRRTEPPAEHRDQVHMAARQAWLGKLRARRRRRWLALAASVAALTASALLVSGLEFGVSGPAARVALSGGTVEWRAPDSDAWQRISEQGVELPADARLRTGADGRAALSLADGGSLRLAENTDIAIRTDRFGLDAGRLYFDSAGRSNLAPITVTTPMGTLSDIGTQFEASVATDYLRIRVREGGIELSGTTASGDVTASRGQEIELSGTEPLVRREIAPDDPAWAWVETLASPPATASRSILIYFRWIARETGKRLVFEPESLEVAAELATFSGDPSGLSPLELLSQIAATSDFDYRLTDDGAILIRRN